MSRRENILSVFFIPLLVLITGSSKLLAQDSTATKYRLKTVVIDAGHGGKDPGTSGKYTKEKDVALAVALKLGKYIEDRIEGVKVIYTRKSDVFVELHKRAEIANKNNADLFICIHANAVGNSKVFGTETYVMGMKYMERNREMMMRENNVVLLEKDYKKTYEGFDPNDPTSIIIQSILQQLYLNHSINFAQKVEDQFKNRVGRHSRGVKQSVLLVLNRTTMPSVLIETGYLTNSSEEKFLASDKGQDYIASAIFRAFREYKAELEGIKYKPDDSAEAIIKDTINNSEETSDLPKDVVHYKVQFMTAQKPLEKTDPTLKKVQDVSYYKQGSSYKYVAGNAKRIEDAKKIKNELVNLGFKDAFIVPFYQGNRISWDEVKKVKANTIN